MFCLKCGMVIKGPNEFFICEDCLNFSRIVQTMFEDLHRQMETTESVDPQTYELFKLLSDTTFITSKNPHTAIFYKLSDYFVSKSFEGILEIPESELNRNVSTTRGWGDAFKIFEELNLIKIQTERYRRVVTLTDKTRKFSDQYLSGESISTIGLTTRLAHIYAGYVLLYIAYKLSRLTIDNFDKSKLPYHQKPRTLWNVLMFLWSTAYDNNAVFSAEEFNKFISKRRIGNTTKGKILNALEAKDGRSTQGLIKDVYLEDGVRKYVFEDYVMREMQRIRVLDRTRTR